MRRQGFGIIVNLSSGAGIIGYPGSSAYISTKFAVEGLTDFFDIPRFVCSRFLSTNVMDHVLIFMVQIMNYGIEIECETNSHDISDIAIII
jgi:hypothetical protein